MSENPKYASNSHRSRDRKDTREEHALEKKAPKGSGIVEQIFPSGSLRPIRDYILDDVVVPTVKKMISEIVCGGINMLLGEPNAKIPQRPAEKVSYRKYYDSHDNYIRTTAPAPKNDKLVFDTRAEAEDVLYRMEEIIDCYGQVSRLDLADLAGFESDYTNDRYGWTDLTGAYIRRFRNGYKLELPTAKVLPRISFTEDLDDEEDDTE